MSLNGESPHIILLHGWGQSKEALRPLSKTLNKYFPAYYHLIDLPGHGSSPEPQTVLNSFEIASQIVSDFQAKGINKVSVIGHSFGGKVATSMAIQNADFVDKLVLMAASGPKAKQKLRIKLKRMALVRLGKILKVVDAVFKTELFKNKFAPRFGSSDYKNASGVMRSILVKSVNEDLAPLLKMVKAPTLLLWGEDDTETPLSVAMKFKKNIRHSQLHLFPHKDHQLFTDVGHHLLSRYILRHFKGSQS